jgi:hypothetical protein
VSPATRTTYNPGTVSLTPGARLGVYEIVGPLGAGGMGEVYRARDTRLGREVALKVLPELFAADPDRLMRFEREAKTLAALNHPRIAQIYGLEESSSPPALIMELVEGEDLAQRLEAGAIPLDEALAIARGVAEALEAAHEAGIIHRDLKPANVKVRPDGSVKVLDFGLAKGGGPVASVAAADLAASPTFTSPALTRMGLIIGTAAYMAPEQAKGKPVDRRADVWAFGCLLFEMLTGRRAFPGEDVTDTLAAIVRGEPEWVALPANVPPSVHRLLRRTLQKDPARRLDSLRAARLELDDAHEEPLAQAGSAPAPPKRGRRAAAAVLVVATLGLIGAAALWRLNREEPSVATRFSITPPPGTTLQFETNHQDLALLPNGQGLVYWNRIGADNQIVLRRFDEFDGTPIAQAPVEARGVFVSADSGWLGFQSGAPSGADAVLMKLPITGATPTRIAAIDGNLRGASWGEDDRIVFATSRQGTGLLRVRASGGDVEVLTTPDATKGEVDHRWPHLLPGGTHALFTLVRRDSTSAIALADLAAGTWRVLVANGTMPRYAAGVLFYAEDAGVRWVRFDERRREIVGDPAPLPFDVVTKGSGAANYDVAADGTFAFRPGGTASASLDLVWTDRAGVVTPIAVEPKAYRGLRLSPDGTRLAATVESSQDLSLWVVDLQRGTVSRVTPPGFSALAVAWHPDGRSLAVPLTHADEREHPAGLFLVSASGTFPPQRLTQPPADVRHVTPSWNADGRVLLYTEIADGRSDIYRIQDGGKPERVLAGPSRLGNQALSPDGRWLAYASNESGQAEVYIRPYPSVMDDRIIVSSGGGSLPMWGRDGRELLYVTPDRTLVAVPVTPGPPLSLGRAEVRTHLQGATGTFAISPDGARVMTTARPSAQGPIANEFRVVLDLIGELKRSVR